MNKQELMEDKKSSTTREKEYRVKAIWKTLQGEGLFSGRPAVFVRLVGCNLWSGYEFTRGRDALRTHAACPLWCDTDFTKEGSNVYSASELAGAMGDIGDQIRFCVLTGGEPLLQIDAALIYALHQKGFFIAIETNGTVRLKDACWDAIENKLVPPDWIVCSPKLSQPSLDLEYFDELKLVLPDYAPLSFPDFIKRQRLHTVQHADLPLLWLQPEDGTRKHEATQLAIETVLAHPDWRVSVQTHKILNVD